jgi:uncharacterized protein (TIGR03435 family)
MVLWMLRRRRTAALQHAVWTAVVCGMLALFALGQTLPRLPLRILNRPSAPVAATPSNRPALSEVLEAGPLPAAVSPMPRRSIDWNGVLVYAYGAVALAFLARFVTGMFLVRKLLARSNPAQNFLESELIAVPMTLGWLRPVILLPPDWRQWDREKLDAVLAHEGAHARRHDGLVAALAAVNRCLFWFHPLAWMLERKLALLAEQACDESCVAALGDRRRYAHLLLEMALVVDGSHGRLRQHALTMASPSHIRRRIDALLQEGRTFSRGLTRMAWAAVMLCGIPLVWAAGAVELDRQPPAQAAVPQPPAPPTPKFDVASVKPCQPGDGAGKSGRGGGRGGSGFGTDPGRLWITCMPVSRLIDTYLGMGNEKPLINDLGGIDSPGRIRGGPAWINTDRYTIEAETNDPVANGPTGGFTPATRLMRGSMLRALLEDRFHLRTHHETEEVPMYALTLAKGGLKIKPMEEGGCRPHDPTQGTRVDDMFPPGQKPMCVGWTHTDGPNWVIDDAGQGLGNLAQALSGLMDRHVLDKTGVNGVYTYHLVFAHDDKTPSNFPTDGLFPASDIPPAGSVFTVLEQQLGLKLVADKGSREYVVIDRVERPSEN